MLNISEVIKQLVDIKDNYGDIRVMIRSTYGEIDFIDELKTEYYKTDKGIEFVAQIWS